MNKIFEIDKTKHVLLIGEGRDEELFFSAFVKHLGLANAIQIAQYGGKNNLAQFLSVLQSLTAFPSLRAIGITRDADSDYTGALTGVYSAVQNAHFPDTLLVKPFILPKEETSGALEALILTALHDSSVWGCVEAFATCVALNSSEPFSATDRDKHRLQAWLSTCPHPGRRLGEAAAAGEIPFNHQAFQPITDFIKSLVSVTENRSSHV